MSQLYFTSAAKTNLVRSVLVSPCVIDSIESLIAHLFNRGAQTVWLSCAHARMAVNGVLPALSIKRASIPPIKQTHGSRSKSKIQQRSVGSDGPAVTRPPIAVNVTAESAVAAANVPEKKKRNNRPGKQRSQSPKIGYDDAPGKPKCHIHTPRAETTHTHTFHAHTWRHTPAHTSLPLRHIMCA